MINLDADKGMLDTTMKLVIRSSNNPNIYQSFKTNGYKMKYNHVTNDVLIDTLFAVNTSKSKHQFTCNQMFDTDFGYTHIFSVKSKGYLHHAMKHFFKKFGLHHLLLPNFQLSRSKGRPK